MSKRTIWASLRRRFERWFGASHKEMRRYKREGGPRKRFDFPWLTQDSIVLDVGGFRGDWADGIALRRPGHIHIFEAHPAYAAALAEKYSDRAGVTVHPVALGNASGSFTMSELGDATSAYRDEGTQVECRVAEACSYLAQAGIDRIDLMKMNIEGAEYELLEHLESGGLMPRIRTLLVQFHEFGPGDAERRDKVRAVLSHTHKEDWCYPFIWEQWSRRDVQLCTLFAPGR